MSSSFNMTTRCCVLLLTILGSTEAFTSLLTSTNTKLIPATHSIKAKFATTSTTNTFSLQMSSKSEQDEENADVGMSFDEATAALAEEEDKERAASRGAMYEEVSFDSLALF